MCENPTPENAQPYLGTFGKNATEPKPKQDNEHWDECDEHGGEG